MKTYKGKEIQKHGNKYIVGGFVCYFNSLEDAKDAIDAAIEEDKALEEANRYVMEVLGGYM